jgi:hypothetical protein
VSSFFTSSVMASFCGEVSWFVFDFSTSSVTQQSTWDTQRQNSNKK